MAYDFPGTAGRNSDAERWRPDAALVEVAAKREARLPPLDPSRNPPLAPSTEYRPVSEFTGESTLGGKTQTQKSCLPFSAVRAPLKRCPVAKFFPLAKLTRDMR